MEISFYPAQFLKKMIITNFSYLLMTIFKI